MIVRDHDVRWDGKKPETMLFAVLIQFVSSLSLSSSHPWDLGDWHQLLPQDHVDERKRLPVGGEAVGRVGSAPTRLSRCLQRSAIVGEMRVGISCAVVSATKGRVVSKEINAHAGPGI